MYWVFITSNYVLLKFYNFHIFRYIFTYYPSLHIFATKKKHKLMTESQFKIKRFSAIEKRNLLWYQENKYIYILNRSEFIFIHLRKPILIYEFMNLWIKIKCSFIHRLRLLNIFVLNCLLLSECKEFFLEVLYVYFYNYP